MGGAQPISLDDIRPVFDRLLKGPLALAVSGGCDSMALLHLAAAWANEPGALERQGLGPFPFLVLTVDHGLRPGAADEAAWVGKVSATLGLPHKTLRWTQPKPASGLQAAARDARYSLILDELRRDAGARAVTGARALVTAHHADDQAETVLMRLARGSGIDGLSGMRERDVLPAPDALGRGTQILRPLLAFSKARLIATLTAAGHEWREDPSNQSLDFERIRMRRALALLGDLGLDAQHIGLSAKRLARARAALMAATAETAARMVRLQEGVFADIDAALLTDVPAEHAVRIFAAALRAFGGDSEPARLSQVEALVTQIGEADAAAHGATLGGCRIERTRDGAIRIWRELGRDGLAKIDLQPGGRAVWDRRFFVTLSDDAREPATVRALGADGMRQISADIRNRHDRLPPDVLATLPSFWRAGNLVAVPQLGIPAGQPQHFGARSIVSVDFGQA